MKKYIIMMLIIISFVLSGCGKKETETTYDIDQTNFFGLGEVLVLEGVTHEDIDQRIELMAKMGAKSHRFWIRVGRGEATESSDCLFRIEKNQMVLNQGYYDDTIYAINKLKKEGINHITLNISWLYGKKDGIYTYYGGNAPSPNDEGYYQEYMETIYETYYKIAELYPCIGYIEMGNEYNANFLAFNLNVKVKMELKSHFILDFSYYASKGIKDANPNIKTVLNGVLDLEYLPTDEREKYFVESEGTSALMRLFDDMYTRIESGEYPSLSTDKSTNPDDYFEVIAYHPYSLKNLESWISGNNKIYSVIEKHHDGGKPVFITEWGYVGLPGASGELYKQIILNKDKTPYIETIHYYIFSDAHDLSQYDLATHDENGIYSYTKSGQVLYDCFGVK